MEHQSIYEGLRTNALQMHLAGTSEGVRLVLMDWPVSNGTASVMASDDGTASVYLSNGGGFIGGGQRYEAIANAARLAVRLADSVLSSASKTDRFDLPPAGTVYFYMRTKDDAYLAPADPDQLKAGTDVLSPLAAVMQQIITDYRLSQPQAGAGIA